MDIIPNRICEGIGETPLAERIAPYIAQANQWWTDNICPTEDNPLIESYALWLAAPLLDCTLHPNGLAVVRTDSLVPASPERVKEFRAAIMRHLIDSLNPIIRDLSRDPGWVRSAPAQRNWYATTFHTPDQIIRATGCPHDWDSLTAAIADLRTAEEADAPRIWSWPFLDILRLATGMEISGSDPHEVRIIPTLIHIIQESARLRLSSCGNKLSAGPRPASATLIIKKLRQLHERFINICKAHPVACREWHASPTSKLYINPTTFRNEKKSSGYFF